MSPNSYAELFFLDEPASYAAGHRPCGDCRKDRYKAFKAAWAKVFPDQDQSAAGIDKVLQTARMNTDNSQRTWQASLADLPDGTMVEHEGTRYCSGADVSGAGVLKATVRFLSL